MNSAVPSMKEVLSSVVCKNYKFKFAITFNMQIFKEKLYNFNISHNLASGNICISLRVWDFVEVLIIL